MLRIESNYNNQIVLLKFRNSYNTFTSVFLMGYNFTFVVSKIHIC
jgi:hypothetical protein